MSGTIFTEPVVVVVQTSRNPLWPDYDLFDQAWTPLGVARRDPPTRLAEVFDIETDPGPLHVFDTCENLLLTADFSRAHARPAVFIHDGKENEVGWLVRMGGVLRPRFDLIHQNRRIGSFEVADRRQRVTNVRDEAGSLVAQVRTITQEGTPFSVPDADTEGYYLHRQQAMPDPLGVLVVGCAVILQAVIGVESSDDPSVVMSITSPGLPAIKDRMKRVFRR